MGETSKLLEPVMKKKRREIIKDLKIIYNNE